MATASAPQMSDKPPTYNEATGSLNAPAGAVPGYGATGGYPPQGDPAGVVKNQPPAGAYPGYQGGYQGPAAGQVYQAPPGYQPAGAVPGQPSYMQTGAHTVLVQPQPSVVIVGGCPACRIGVLEDDFTCLGVCCAIFFFPLGILCCLAMRQRRCPNCGAVFG